MSQTNFFKSGSSKKCCREYNISKKKETNMNNLAPFLAQGRNYL